MCDQHDDLIGQRFNYLEIKELAYKNHNGRHYYVFCPKCGKNVSANLSTINKGNRQTCSTKCYYFSDLVQYIGGKYERLTIKDVFFNEEKQRNYFLCDCECGATDYSTSSHYVLDGRTRSCGCLFDEHTLAMTGENNPFWKGGITQQSRYACLNTSYRKWRQSVLKRDDFKCQYPGCTDKKRLHAHHILPFASHKHLRYDIDNGITLCAHHHNEYHSFAGRIDFCDKSLNKFFSLNL